jgi:hypothetical protein
MGFDQLEQFTETQYTFLIANIRTANPNIKLYVRSSFNPGGVGHLWVKKRFIESKEPYKTYTVDYDVKKPDGTMMRVNYDSVFIPTIYSSITCRYKLNSLPCETFGDCLTAIFIYKS